MTYELTRPLHLDDGLWQSISSYRRRFALACQSDDRPQIVGAGRELIECVARCVLAATGETLGDHVKFPTLIDGAHKALNRQGGRDVSQSEEIKAIASAARTIAVSVAPLRNSVGTGHGRARLAPIDDEMAAVVADATMLWCKWALRRLGHLLAGYPSKLIEQLHNSSNRNALQAAFDAVFLPSQPPGIQHRLGVIFGQSAAGGYGNAYHVAVLPAVEGDLDSFPIDYRLGLAEGMLFTANGQLGLTAWYVPAFLDILVPVPASRVAAKLRELAAAAESATWIRRARLYPVDPAETLVALDQEQIRLTSTAREALQRLRASMDQVANLPSEDI